MGLTDFVRPPSGFSHNRLGHIPPKTLQSPMSTLQAKEGVKSLQALLNLFSFNFYKNACKKCSEDIRSVRFRFDQRKDILTNQSFCQKSTIFIVPSAKSVNLHVQGLGCNNFFCHLRNHK